LKTLFCTGCCRAIRELGHEIRNFLPAKCELRRQCRDLGDGGGINWKFPQEIIPSNEQAQSGIRIE
jgi:hypothetical protein